MPWLFQTAVNLHSYGEGSWISICDKHTAQKTCWRVEWFMRQQQMWYGPSCLSAYVFVLWWPKYKALCYVYGLVAAPWLWMEMCVFGWVISACIKRCAGARRKLSARLHSQGAVGWNLGWGHRWHGNQRSPPVWPTPVGAMLMSAWARAHILYLIIEIFTHYIAFHIHIHLVYIWNHSSSHFISKTI